MQEIKYLVKFVENEEFAHSLMDGNLYLNTIAYFHLCYYKEYYKKYKTKNDNTLYEFMKSYKGAIGDIREAMIFDCAHLPANIPVYCFHKIYKSQCKMIDKIEHINLDENVVKEFKATGKRYFVIIDYNEVKQSISDISNFGDVIYSNKSKESDAQIIMTNWKKIYYFKQPHFAYQQEYRLIFDSILPDGFEFKPFDVLPTDKSCEFWPRGHKEKYEGHLFKLGKPFKTAQYQSINDIKNDVITIIQQ